MSDLKLNDVVRVNESFPNPVFVWKLGTITDLEYQVCDGRKQIEVLLFDGRDDAATRTTVYCFANELDLVATSVSETGPDVDELVEELHGTPDESWYITEDTVGLKPTNPKDAVGSDKLPLHLFPMTAVAAGALGLLDGMLKYGRSNWREAGVRATIYVDALERHVTAWVEGEDVDPDSGLPHLFHAIACLAILIDADAAGKLVDDRNFNGAGWRRFVDEMTPHVARLKEKHAARDPRHFTIADNPSSTEGAD